MPFQKVEFEFPDEQEAKKPQDIEVEGSSAVEIDLSGKKSRSARQNLRVRRTLMMVDLRLKLLMIRQRLIEDARLLSRLVMSLTRSLKNILIRSAIGLSTSVRAITTSAVRKSKRFVRGKN